MKSSAFLTLQEQLRRYIADELTLDAFREWFTPATWEHDSTPDADARELGYEIVHHRLELYGRKRRAKQRGTPQEGVTTVRRN